MKTKILSLIDNRINGISDKNLFDALSNSFYIDFLKELRQEIEEMQESSQWIPVTERLPEKGQFVFCLRDCGDSKHYFHTNWNNEDERYMDWNNVTHWMPLPPHP